MKRWLFSIAVAAAPVVGWSQAFAPGPVNAVRPEYRTAARSLIVQRLDRSRMVATTGAVHVETARAADLGAVDDRMPMEHLQLALRRPAERQAAFDAVVDALNKPGSPIYRQWLTPEQIGTEFGPSAADIASVRSYLESEGFRVNGVGKSGMYVDFTGTAAQVRASFATEVHYFQMRNGDVHFSAVRAARIPEALAPAVLGFVAMSDIPQHSLRRRSRQAVPLYLDRHGNQTEGAQDFYTIYNERPLLTGTGAITGTGQTVALIEETDINTNDVKSFRSYFGVTPATPSLTVAHGSSSISCSDPGITSTDEEGEAVLDTEWAGTAAPSAKLLFMSCQSAATDGITLSAEAVVDDNLAGTMSVSYGGTETGQGDYGTFIAGVWEQAAAQGQTVVVSAGDSGSDTASDNASIASNGINVNVLGSTAYNVSAGGTDFQDEYNQLIDNSTAYGVSAFWKTSNGTGELTAKSYIPETTWNDSCASSLLNTYEEGSTAPPQALCEDSNKNGNYLAPAGGGGGPSVVNARPAWQIGTVYGLPPTSAYSGRLLPDVSLFAANGLYGHAIYLYQSDVHPSLYDEGGTSFVAPQLAGVFALVAEKTGQRLGIPNWVLYNLAGQQFGTTAFTGSACNGSGASGSGETTSLPSSSCIFYDIQTGNNSDGCSLPSTNCFGDPGAPDGLISTSLTQALPAFATGQGYDMATGIGSLNIANLVNNWTSGKTTPALSVNPVSTVYGTGVTNLTVSIAYAGPVPAGAVSVTVDSGAAVAATCTGSASPETCTAAYATTTLNVGSHAVAATLAADANYDSTSGTGTLTVTAAAPAIVFSVPDHDASDGPFTVAATSNSGGAFTYSVTGGPATNSGAIVTLTGTGTVVLQATQAANGNYAAGSASATFYSATGGMVWVGNQNSTLSAFNASGTAQSPMSGYSGGGLGTISSPLGLAFDHSGNLWIANSGNGGGIGEFSPAGSPLTSTLYTGGGISNPLAVAVDGLGQIWVANGNGSVSVLSGAGAGVSPSTGYTGAGLSTPGGIAVDVSGNVWVSNTSDNSVTEILGVAGPVAPLSTAVKNGTTGARP